MARRPVICAPRIMGTKVTFKPGWRQAADAADYFNGLAAELVRVIVGRTIPRLYLIAESGHRQLTVLLWVQDHSSHNLPDLVPLLRALNTDAIRLARAQVAESLVMDFIKAVMSLRVDDGQCFAEVFSSPRAFMSGRDPLLSIAVEGGRMTLVSAAKLLFVQQTDELFGMTIADHGSYLVEQMEDGSEGDIMITQQDTGNAA
jgi:hypothetical protein